MLFVYFLLLLLPTIFAIPKVKGWLGEKSVEVYLSRLDKDKYKLLNNLLLTNHKGNTSSTQIDHVLVSVYGIFVIETKNWSGAIYGSEFDQNWTQVLNKHTKIKKHNPLRQNFAHVEAVRELLTDWHDVPIIPIIAFTNTAELKKVPEKSIVVNTNRLASTIRKYNNPALTPNDVKRLSDFLLRVGQHDRKAARKHVENIRQTKAKRETAVSQEVCPVCGGKLVSRSGRYGRFTGCSNYPDCTFKTK